MNIINEQNGTITAQIDECDNANGTKAGSTWTMTAEQAAKHLPMFEGGVPQRTEIVAGVPRFAVDKIAKGDASAIRDAASEFLKQVES